MDLSFEVSRLVVISFAAKVIVRRVKQTVNVTALKNGFRYRTIIFAVFAIDNVFHFLTLPKRECSTEANGKQDLTRPITVLSVLIPERS